MQSFSSYGEFKYKNLGEITWREIAVLLLGVSLFFLQLNLYERHTTLQYCKPSFSLALKEDDCYQAMKNEKGLPFTSHTEILPMQADRVRDPVVEYNKVFDGLNFIMWVAVPFAVVSLVRYALSRS